jgi:hypothetical protein
MALGCIGGKPHFRNLSTLRANTIHHLGHKGYDWEYVLWTVDTRIIHAYPSLPRT